MSHEPNVCDRRCLLRFLLASDKKKPGDAKGKDGDNRANGKAASGGGGIEEETGSSAGRGGGGKSSADKEAVDPAERKRREDFGRLTDLADGLLQAGLHDVYQLTKEEMEEAAAEAVEKERGWASSSGEREVWQRRKASNCSLRKSYAQNTVSSQILNPKWTFSSECHRPFSASTIMLTRSSHRRCRPHHLSRRCHAPSFLAPTAGMISGDLFFFSLFHLPGPTGGSVVFRESDGGRYGGLS